MKLCRRSRCVRVWSYVYLLSHKERIEDQQTLCLRTRIVSMRRYCLCACMCLRAGIVSTRRCFVYAQVLCLRAGVWSMCRYCLHVVIVYAHVLCLGAYIVSTRTYCVYEQVLCLRASIVSTSKRLKFCHGCFLPHPFEFIIHWPS